MLHKQILLIPHNQLFRNFWTLPHPSPDMLHTLCVGGDSSAQDTPGSPPPPGATKNCRCRPALTHLSSPPEFASENCTRAREKVMNGSTWVVPRTGVLATTTTTQLMLRVCVFVCVLLCFLCKHARELRRADLLVFVQFMQCLRKAVHRRVLDEVWSRSVAGLALSLAFRGHHHRSRWQSGSWDGISCDFWSGFWLMFLERLLVRSWTFFMSFRQFDLFPSF